MEQLKKEVAKFSALEAVKLSEGGEILIKSLKKDIVDSIDSLSMFKTLSHIELISICAKLSERLALFRVLNRSSKNKKLAIKELDELLIEEDAS